MNTQVNVRLAPELLQATERYAKQNGYGSIQEVMREALRETVLLSAEDRRALREAKADLTAGRTRRIV